jgi:hypothetical protein
MKSFLSLFALVLAMTVPLAHGGPLTWDTVSTGIDKSGNPILFADGQFVAGFGFDTEGGEIATSSNGLNWTTDLTVGAGVSGIYSLGYGNGTFVAGGNWGNSYASTNGTTWTPGSYSQAAPINAISYGDGRFVGVGNGGMIMTSTNGLSWTAQSSSTGLNFNALAYNGKIFLAAAYSNGTASVQTSTDGVNWTTATAPGNISRLTYGNGEFIGVSNVGGGSIYTTTDGLTWKTVYSSSTGLNGITFDGSHFIAVGNGGLILISENGTNWVQDASGTTADLCEVAYGDNRFVINEANTSGDVLVATVPDNGATIAMLAMALGGLVLLRYKIRPALVRV